MISHKRIMLMMKTTAEKFIEVVRILLIILFVYASVTKAMDYEGFQTQMSQSPMITSIAAVLVWVVPAAEIALAMLLTTQRFLLPGLYLSYGLMIAFSVYIVIITRYSDYVPCACGGVLSRMGWNTHLVFNLGFVVLNAAGILLYRKDTTQVE